MKHRFFDTFHPGLLLVVFLFSFTHVFADEFTSSSFRVLDPVMAPSGFSTSTGFQLWSTISEIAVGTSSITSFQLGGGFLRYPFASTPVVSATAGNAQVALSWTASTGYLGWTATGYSVGQSTTSGGPYSYSALGNVLSSTRTGLSNGTTYYFVIVVKDIFGNFIATSTQVSGAPSAPASSGGGGSSGATGGGGGGGGVVISESGLKLSGRAYPLSKVSVLKDGQLELTTIAGPDSKFETKLNNLSTGNYTFSVYGEDKDGRRSAPFTFPLYITSGSATTISGIFIAPTLAVDKSEVKRGDNIAIFGQSVQSSDIVISVNSAQEFFINKKADSDGVYLFNFDTSVLDLGRHSTKSKSSVEGEISPFGDAVGFAVGTKNVAFAGGSEKCPLKGDLNGDCKVNLVDFSIAAFWYKKTLSPTFKAVELKNLNGDGQISLVDFSIMAYYWTG